MRLGRPTWSQYNSRDTWRGVRTTESEPQPTSRSSTTRSRSDKNGRFSEGRHDLAIHLPANGEDTTAYLKVAFRFHPNGYALTKKRGTASAQVNDSARHRLIR